MSVGLLSMGLYQRGSQEREATFVVRLAIGFSLGMVLVAAVGYAIPAVSIEQGVLGLSLHVYFVG